MRNWRGPAPAAAQDAVWSRIRKGYRPVPQRSTLGAKRIYRLTHRIVGTTAIAKSLIAHILSHEFIINNASRFDR